MSVASDSIRLVYCGCGLAGKTVSLMSALNRCGVPLPEPLSQFSTREHRFDVKRRSGGSLELFVRISEQRALRTYDPTGTALDPLVVAEIDAIARADALVFVIDSQVARTDANVGAFDNLFRDLRLRGLDPEDIPIVFQANKRDLADIVTMDWVRERFRTPHCGYVESVAPQQIGTLEAMREAISLTARKQPYR